MYLQITTKCNMRCAHCCYSCGPRGKHMAGDVWRRAIDMAREWDEMISIGGGEPTLHPDFFLILKTCLQEFDYVWMATNGSQTSIMRRLSDIIQGGDYPGECPYDSDEDEGAWEVWMDENTIIADGKLTVALSQDYYHDPIDEKIRELWKARTNRNGFGSRHNGFEIRDVTRSKDGPSAAGRAKKTGAGWAEHCVCPDIIIRPDGKLKACGCPGSPVIGDVWEGIEEKWQEVRSEEEYRDSNCYIYYRKHKDYRKHKEGNR